MAKVYSLPDGFDKKVPPFDWNDSRDQRNEKEKKFLDELKAWAIKRNPEQEFVGEVIKFPAADGYALYMVAAIKPVQMIHLPLGDAYTFQYANRITKADIKQKVEGDRAMEKLFAEKRKEKES